MSFKVVLLMGMVCSVVLVVSKKKIARIIMAKTLITTRTHLRRMVMKFVMNYFLYNLWNNISQNLNEISNFVFFHIWILFADYPYRSLSISGHPREFTRWIVDLILKLYIAVDIREWFLEQVLRFPFDKRKRIWNESKKKRFQSVFLRYIAIDNRYK